MKEKKWKFTDLWALLVFALFALCVWGVLLTGAGVYRRLVSRGEESFYRRTALQYVSTRVRQSQWVCVEDFQGCETLVLGETIGEKRYVTRVYCWDGQLRELFSAENALLSPGDGESILEADHISFSLEEGVLTAKLQDEIIVLYLRSGREASP